MKNTLNVQKGGPKFLLRARIGHRAIGPRAPEHFSALAAPILVKNRLITRKECIDDEHIFMESNTTRAARAAQGCTDDGVRVDAGTLCE